MPIRLYLDEDTMARALVSARRARNVDVTTVAEEGMTGRSDEEPLEFAARRGRTLYTFNVADFCRLHEAFLAAGRSHAGIIVVARRRFSVGEQLRRLLNLIHHLSASEMVDALEFLNAW